MLRKQRANLGFKKLALLRGELVWLNLFFCPEKRTEQKKGEND
jgi:hypothetical protein